MRRASASALAALAALLSACSVSGPWVHPEWLLDNVEPDPAEVDVRLLLIGDAGLARDGDPVLSALSAAASAQPDRTWVVFLGDNIYPSGLPPRDDPEFATAERQLLAQVEAATKGGAHAVFVPGNHDYAHGGFIGWERERSYLEALADPRVTVAPSRGCPGPEALDVGTQLRLVALDSQWWMQDGDRPTCDVASAPAFSARLDSTLAGAGARHVVVVAHHPLVTNGSHGGHFDWQDHIFPLTAAASWAWLPLPVIGSLFPISRQMGITEQDLSNGRYQEMSRSIAEGMRRHPPLLYAAGHEHTLQMHRGASTGTGTEWHVVSGSGTLDRHERVGRGDDTLFACGCSGFVRLDFLRDGRVWLQIVPIPGADTPPPPVGRWLAKG